MIDELRTLVTAVSQYEQLGARALVTTLFVAVLCGFLVYLLYRFFYRGVIYSENFGILIVLVTATAALIFITIGANLVLSLGMVGALSIVRFRAAIKEPLDVGFLFLGIAAGLASGARLYLVAILGTVAIGLVYIAMSYLRKEKRNFLLILQYGAESDKDVNELLETLKYKLKNKSVAAGSVELTVEVDVKRNDTGFMETFTSADFINSAALVEYSGDYS